MPLTALGTSAAFGTGRRSIFDLRIESDNWAGYQTPQRMRAKLKAIPLPFMLGRRVLDVGCDAGFFSFLAAERGASEVVGLDRNRHVKGVGYVDLVALNRKRAEDEGRRNVRFEHIDVGKQWHEFGQFEVVFLFSLYHHIYECAGGDHRPIWFWLWRHCSSNAVVIWENPTDCSDPVVRANVSVSYQANFTRDALLRVAGEYFEAEFIGPALHEPTREVWVFHPKQIESRLLAARVKSGGGGASNAFAYADGRRIQEIETILRMRPKPGSFNLETAGPFKWTERYYRAQILDVVDRSLGLDSQWAMRWARFYPVMGNAFAFRFEDESYPDNFVELIAEYLLADVIGRQRVVLCN
jgi:SAM-dependent methyltransferase